MAYLEIERKLGGGGRLGLIWLLGLEEKFFFVSVEMVQFDLV
jgi:hypothetical protein